MPLPPLKYTTAHVTLNVPVDEPTPRTDEIRAQLAQVLAPDTQTQLEPALPDEAPAEVPFLVLSGRSSQVAFSQVQADLELEFYDAYLTSSELCRTLVADKGQLLLKAWTRIDAHPVWDGIVIKLRAPMSDSDDAPVRHLLETQLRAEYNGDALHEAKVQIGLRLHDRYFVTLAINPYEARRVQLAGTRSEPIRPWEGEVADRGLDVTVDINNRYGALLEKKFRRITEEDLVAMNDLAWQLVDDVAIPFARDGALDLSTIHQVVA
jgi:hypothetical protein